MIITSSVSEIVEIIRNGGVIAYPTEAVWGLGCDPYNEHAVRRILALKSRPEEKGLILITGHKQQLLQWQNQLNERSFERLISLTESPTSWVVPDITVTPTWIRGKHQSVAIRLSQHQPVIDLCNHLEQAIVSTSANPAGEEPAMNIDELKAYFGESLDAIYNAPLGEAKSPSQVKDILTGKVFRD
ncbi:L-threonylcarbamoyladenylate synthase [Marinomonas balearica]|uniref:Threonylcarbamoyl-AMP synthase n=1 Tax=Marinomonas balearica TaxID=491947 RepID=A0A4R6M969_9GAMM|nr:Sua5/YciO/YrdC/YwlC family protein [Marinomonas balearica]TDO97934.1 L-threonylcarbamoyladenylate synthase [Marinomonas balearica]